MKDEIAYSGPDPHQRGDEKTRRNFDAALGREADVFFELRDASLDQPPNKMPPSWTTLSVSKTITNLGRFSGTLAR
jgi:hypothetical protein